jgi:transcriptional regulator with XRE-family HTH domain
VENIHLFCRGIFLSSEAEIFRKRSRQRMEELGINVNELAARLEEPQSNVSMYLTGKRNPKWEKIEKWATKALECDPYWLSGRTKPDGESVRLRELTEYEIAAKMLGKYLPEGERREAALLLLSCDENTFNGVVGGLRPFIKLARKAKNVSAG